MKNYFKINSNISLVDIFTEILLNYGKNLPKLFLLFFILFNLSSCKDDVSDIIDNKNKGISKKLNISIYIDNSLSMKEFLTSNKSSGCEHDKHNEEKNYKYYSPYKKLFCDSIYRAIEKTWSKNDTKINLIKLSNNSEIKTLKEALKNDFYVNKHSDISKLIETFKEENFKIKDHKEDDEKEENEEEDKNYKKEHKKNKNIDIDEEFNKNNLQIIVTDLYENNDLSELVSSIKLLKSKGKDIGFFCIKSDINLKDSKHFYKPFYLIMFGNAIDIEVFSDNLKSKELQIADQINGFIYTISDSFVKDLPKINEIEYKYDDKDSNKYIYSEEKSFVSIKNRDMFSSQIVELDLPSSTNKLFFSAKLNYSKLNWTLFSYLIVDEIKKKKNSKQDIFNIEYDYELYEYDYLDKKFIPVKYNQNFFSYNNEDKKIISDNEIQIKGNFNFDNLSNIVNSQSIYKIKLSTKISLTDKTKAIPTFINEWNDYDLEFFKKLITDIVTSDNYKLTLSDIYFYIRR